MQTLLSPPYWAISDLLPLRNRNRLDNNSVALSDQGCLVLMQRNKPEVYIKYIYTLKWKIQHPNLGIEIADNKQIKSLIKERYRHKVRSLLPIKSYAGVQRKYHTILKRDRDRDVFCAQNLRNIYFNIHILSIGLGVVSLWNISA